MFSFLTTLKSDNTFKITKNWKCYKKLHPDISKNYITLIQATGLNHIFPHILHYFYQNTHKSQASSVATRTLQVQPSVNHPVQNPLQNPLQNPKSLPTNFFKFTNTLPAYTPANALRANARN